MKWCTTACVFAAVGLLAWGAALAAPSIPADDNLVLETGLPTIDPRMREMHVLAGRMREHPDDLATAMLLASRQLAMGVAEADPRFIGYARGTLTRWWQDDAATPPLRILRARILQAQHEFAPAAADLRAALRETPDAAQAFLVLASIDEVTGDLAEAKDACARFADLRRGLAAVACAASIGSLSGAAGASKTALTDAIDQYPTADWNERLWAYTILGEIAVRQDDAAAERYFQQALALNRRDVYALTVYADYLLDQGRAAEVLRLLQGFERVDALYLRLALAAQATGDSRFPAYRGDVAARYEAARRQGDTVHLRDASRYALEIEHDGIKALDFARQNWSPRSGSSQTRYRLGRGHRARGPRNRTAGATPRIRRLSMNKAFRRFVSSDGSSATGGHSGFPRGRWGRLGCDYTSVCLQRPQTGL
jgi:tetratricopeptide (TPR) repeat protein